MKRPHTISRDELITDMEEERWTKYSSFSTRNGSKYLSFSSRGNFKVTVSGTVIYSGQSVTDAVNAYNEA